MTVTMSQVWLSSTWNVVSPNWDVLWIENTHQILGPSIKHIMQNNSLITSILITCWSDNILCWLKKCIKISTTYFFYFFKNKATSKFKPIFVAYIIFLLDNTDFLNLWEILIFTCFILQKLFLKGQINTISKMGWINVQVLYKISLASLNWKKWGYIFILVKVI